MSDPKKKSVFQRIKDNVIVALLACTAFSPIGLLLNGTTDPEGAKQAIEPLGLDQVTITGKASLFDTGRGYYRTAFSAVNNKGEKVNGVVYQGFKFLDGTPTIKFLNPPKK